MSPSKSIVKGLLSTDVVLANDAIRVRIRRSKTDVFGRGEWIPLKKVKSVACPVGGVAEYVQVRKEGVAFLAHADGTPVTRYQFTTVFRKSLDRLGLRSSE